MHRIILAMALAVCAPMTAFAQNATRVQTCGTGTPPGGVSFTTMDAKGNLCVSSSVTATDGSTTITAGGTAQTLFGGTTPAHGFEVCDPGTTDDLWVSDSTTAAANNTGSFRVALNGGCYVTPPGRSPVGAVSVYGATTGDRITARSW